MVVAPNYGGLEIFYVLWASAKWLFELNWDFLHNFLCSWQPNMCSLIHINCIINALAIYIKSHSWTSKILNNHMHMWTQRLLQLHDWKIRNDNIKYKWVWWRESFCSKLGAMCKTLWRGYMQHHTLSTYKGPNDLYDFEHFLNTP